jgi:DNA-binding CsgD family transcriptional regulator
MYDEIAEALHQEEIEIYIKKIEHAAFVEKQNMIQLGKPTYTKAILDEVVELRKEHDSLKKKHIELQKAIAEIEKLIEQKSTMKRQEAFIEQLYQMVTKGATTQPSLESLLLESDTLYPEFSTILLRAIPSITAMELKIGKLIKLGLTSQTMANLFGVTVKNIESHRMRLRKKCTLRQNESLSSYIMSLQ